MDPKLDEDGKGTYDAIIGDVGKSLEANENSTGVGSIERHAGRSLELALGKIETSKIIPEDSDVRSLVIFFISFFVTLLSLLCADPL